MEKKKKIIKEIPKRNIKRLINNELNLFKNKFKNKSDELYLSIICYLGNSYTLSKPDFVKRFKKLETDIKRGRSFKEASSSFLSFLDKSYNSTSDVVLKEIKKPQIFDYSKNLSFYEGLKEVWKTYKGLDKDETALILYKSYFIEKAKLHNENKFNDYIKSHDHTYICHVLGIPVNRYKKDPKIKKAVSITNEIVLDYITRFKKSLIYYITMLIDESAEPNTKKWIIDVFHKRALRYITAKDAIWEEYKKRSHNKPNYRKSYKEFKEYMNNPKHRYFRCREISQGAIVFLGEVDALLYGMIDEENETNQKIINEVNKVLRKVHPSKIVMKILPALNKEYTEKLPKLTLLQLLSQP